jgi:hypothetical protein
MLDRLHPEQGWNGLMRRIVSPTTGQPLEPFSHPWWLRKLNRRLDDRQAQMRRWVDYYDGRHTVKLVSERFRDEFAKRFPEYADNFMPLVVDTENNRLHVQGVRYGSEPEADTEAWAWWQENHLDSDSSLAHKDALLKGVVNILVWPDERTGEPIVTIEDALQTVVDATPGRRWERRGALKRWMDDDEHMLAELYMPEATYRYRTTEKATQGRALEWQPVEWGGISQVRNRIGVVPIVPLVNRPRLSHLSGSGGLLDYDDGTSELATVIGNQDHINAYRMIAMVASEFASFRQRYLLNADMPIDPSTGREIAPFAIGVDRLWVMPPPDPEEYPDASKAPKVEFGEFEQTDTNGLVELIRGELRRLATKAQMPYHYLLESQTVPPSGESIKSAEAAFVMKVTDAQTNLGEGWEEVFRLNFMWRGDPRGQVTDSEIQWKTPESRSEAVLTDAMVKAMQFGVHPEVAQARWGMSPQEIERNRRLGMVTDLRQRALAPVIEEEVQP